MFTFYFHEEKACINMLYQMRKGDKGMKVWGLIVILAIIVSVFGGAAFAFVLMHVGFSTG
jgi:hypothetical protein